MMNHILFFLPLISRSILLAQRSWHDKLLRGNYDILIKQRPNAIFPSLPNYNKNLSNQGFGPQYPVAVSRHHIIPYNVLRDFYNNVIKRRDAFRLQVFLKMLASKFSRYYHDATGRNTYWNGNVISNVECFIFSLFYGSVNQDDGAIHPPCFEIFESFYIFQPGNMFTGPANRSDDPKQDFEQNAASIVGDKRFKILKRVNELMIAYNNKQPVDFGQLSDGLKVIANYRMPESLKASHWVNNGNGTYRIRKSLTSSVPLAGSYNNTENDSPDKEQMGEPSHVFDYLELSMFKVIISNFGKLFKAKN